MKPINHFKSKNISQSPSISTNQDGMALLSIVLMLLVVIGLVSMTASKTTILETKMLFNMQDKQRSLLAADSAALYAWKQIKGGVDIKQLINNDVHPGYYVLGDKIQNITKSASDWDSIENVVSWPWDDDTKRFEIPEQLGGTTNPMKLISNPQYIVGMQNAVVRKGTSDYRCIPLSIIGASKGGTTQTRTLIELKTVPQSTCYHEKIK